MHEKRPRRRSARNRGDNEERGIHLEEFRKVLRSVMGPDIEDTWVQRFYDEVNRAQIKRCQYSTLCLIIQHIQVSVL